MNSPDGVAKSAEVAEPTKSLRETVVNASVVICCGSGGVGKTTSAAVIAMRAAHDGRKAVVVTIDPAKRLADALGLESLSNEPALVEGVGENGGQMWAMMLDTKSTFDDLVTRYSADTDQRDRILNNGFYHNISTAMSGTQEYMASEKLYELAVESDYDLVVVDTPPTRNALDFLEAPQQLARFLDHRLYKVLVSPTSGLVKAVHFAAQTVMRSIAKVVGAEVVADAMEFFTSFEGMEEGFKDRAREVDRLMREPDTAFVLVASPNSDTVAEASYFAQELRRMDITVRSLIVNRMHPSFDSDTEQSRGPASWSGIDLPDASPLLDLIATLEQSRSVADAEHSHLHGISADVAPAPVIGVPVLPFEVSDLPTLAELGTVMFDPGSELRISDQ